MRTDAILERDPIPRESIYMWMYRVGLAGADETEVMARLRQAGKAIRRKDIENFERGAAKHTGIPNAAHTQDMLSMNDDMDPVLRTHIWDLPKGENLEDRTDRWVPCDASNKPIVRWSETRMNKAEAESVTRAYYLAENLERTPFVVIDIDGDHDGVAHPELVLAFDELRYRTHSIAKRRSMGELMGLTEGRLMDVPSSYHLMFTTDRSVHTRHFTEACIDLLGNRTRQLRYWKDKRWNGVFPQPLTDSVWRQLMEYVSCHR